MKPFRSKQQLARYFAVLAEKHRREEARRAAIARRKALREARREARRAAKPSGDMVVVVAGEGTALNSQSAAVGLYTTTESVTNVQHVGVDEGGIVKVHGNHLVVLRRGRLFTIALNDAELKPISAVDAFGPDMEPGSWYDEMLISEDTVVVIGYSYQRGGTEVGLFDISNDGQLAYRSTYHLSSGDYYSSRNYASRLIGNKLIFYTPQYVNPYAGDPAESFPAVRKWHEGATASEFHPIVEATRVYLPERNFDPNEGMTFHTVTVCDLANKGFDCRGTTVLGPSGRVFYVSSNSVYVWASPWSFGQKKRSLLFRMPLDGSGPSALRVSGSPVDQFSFLESADQHLNVLVRSESHGDGMWAAEVAEGDVALMRIPIRSFSDGSEAVPAYRYRQLQKPEGYTFQNRFVANYLIYGTGSGWGYPKNVAQPNLFIVDWTGGKSYQLPLPHGVDRIEAMGSDAVIVGTDGTNLHFSSVRLGQVPELVSRYMRQDASQGELRSHGFFYKPDGDNSGTLGLPISVPGRAGYQHLFQNSAAILFLRNDALQFREVGELGSQPETAIDDQCRASCVDWYGNARPLFLRGRVFALLGYELVEGTLGDGHMQELRRINYAPANR
ncbi:MAG TPA: beta-propeller domain-containing protein [Pyrinomonadaceae bacterium]|nr:beta-propeller domain-containing protein [Pyrinomonadaceae bacterium]